MGKGRILLDIRRSLGIRRRPKPKIPWELPLLPLLDLRPWEVGGRSASCKIIICNEENCPNEWSHFGGLAMSADKAKPGDHGIPKIGKIARR